MHSQAQQHFVVLNSSTESTSTLRPPRPLNIQGTLERLCQLGGRSRERAALRARREVRVTDAQDKGAIEGQTSGCIHFVCRLLHRRTDQAADASSAVETAALRAMERHPPLGAFTIVDELDV